MEILQGNGLDLIERDDSLLLVVKFKDQQGHDYEWMPKWDSIRDLFKLCLAVEYRNTGEGPEFHRFAETMDWSKELSHLYTGVRYGQVCLETSEG